MALEGKVVLHEIEQNNMAIQDIHSKYQIGQHIQSIKIHTMC